MIEGPNKDNNEGNGLEQKTGIPVTELSILDALKEFAGVDTPDAKIVGKLFSDEGVLYSLEIFVNGAEEGETVIYTFEHDARFVEGQPSGMKIYSAFYEGEDLVGGDHIATYNPETGEWEKA